MLTTVQLACIVMSISGAPSANFGAQMSTEALLHVLPTLVYLYNKYVIVIHNATHKQRRKP